MIVMADLTAPPWMPPTDTVEAVAAGAFWDAVAVPQHIGLNALEYLDRSSERRPGPIVWDSSILQPRIYFLIPVGTETTMWRHERRLSVGTYVALPGPTTVGPPGVYWLVPPSPEDPQALVDPATLRRALDRVRTETTGEYRPAGGRLQRMLVTSTQLAGGSCIICGETGRPMGAAGVVLVPADGSPEFDSWRAHDHVGFRV
ncbi:hypothetical protein [Kitasatospora viridis]|uniref:Uncharacterized protein n=1 Tax=Kitasatospora viridis TaxID=281105 RepID=A0A561TVY4_9ACTN|nr:hypothetical protein [Kitasatospora viridis]TWF91267.1 hypothetical protein FHX73_12379 [Kitasatospora viridis]